jgi:serine protease Do
MKNGFKAFFFIFIAFFSGILGSAVYQRISDSKVSSNQLTVQGIPKTLASENPSRDYVDIPINANFVKASNASRPAVVFIKAIKEGSNQSYSFRDMFFDFFSERGPSVSSGSGVIISKEGYIVTNQHVIKNSDRVEVVVNNRKKNYKATIIGTDPSSDLALLKIEAENLPFLEFSNSDMVDVGEWVLAVGNPFNLTSTVTSGIVSAKGRNINVSKEHFPIESFIQTDAAINPGNSGGALVNLDGKLIGINSAIISRTGSYAGYGFAIPSNIVSKIVNDLKEFGMVQRAFIESEIIDIDEQLASKLGDENTTGVYLNKIVAEGNADLAGLKKEDIIIRFNEANIKDRAGFDELLAYRRPGEKARLEVLRSGKIIKLEITLVNSEGKTELLKNTMIVSDRLGASFKSLSKIDKQYFGIDYGVRVNNIKAGMMKDLNLPNDFIILHVNNQKFDNAKELVQVLENSRGWISVKGITPEGWIVTRSIRVY